MVVFVQNKGVFRIGNQSYLSSVERMLSSFFFTPTERGVEFEEQNNARDRRLVLERLRDSPAHLYFHAAAGFPLCAWSVQGHASDEGSRQPCGVATLRRVIAMVPLQLAT